MTGQRGRGVMMVECVRQELRDWNPTVSLTYDADDQLIQIDETEGTISIRQVWTWVAGVPTTVGPWTKV